MTTPGGDIGYGAFGSPADVAVVHEVLAAFARRDEAAFLALLHEDVELSLQATADRVGRGGPYRGHDGARAYLADVARAWRRLELHPIDVRAAVGGVVLFGHVEGEALDGTPLVRRAAWSWRLRGGRVVRIRADDLGDLQDVPS